MPQLLSEFVRIDRKFLAASGTFDTVLDCDSRFFINFSRVKVAKTPEFAESYERILQFFRELGVIVKAARIPGDRMYREAANRLQMSEFEELCLGYSFASTAGRGSGPKLKNLIIGTAKEIIDAGVEDPEIFELVGLFEEGMGPDRISDMIARIIRDDLVSYSQRIVSEFETVGILDDVQVLNGLIQNPHNGKSVILVPSELLHELPIAREWEDIDYICQVNTEVRQRINLVVGAEWRKLTARQKKDVFRRVVLGEVDLLRGLIEDYRKFELAEYDFKADPLGEALWLPLGREFAAAYPLSITRPPAADTKWLKTIVNDICDKFKQLIETNGLNEILYTSDGKPRHERIAQRAFYAIADSYCDANGIDISPEVNSGRGPVDFKFAIDRDNKVIVEVKLTTNTHLLQGYEKQLNEYKRSERTEEAFYLVIDNGGSQKKIQALLQLHDQYKNVGSKTHELVIIDGRLKPSASKL